MTTGHRRVVVQKAAAGWFWGLALELTFLCGGFGGQVYLHILDRLAQADEPDE